MNMSISNRELMMTLGQAGRRRRVLALRASAQKNEALTAMAAKIRRSAADILSENARDLENAKARELKGSFLDRLTLNEARLEAMAKGLEDIAALPDPVGQVMAKWTRPNGLEISRVRVPIGVIGIIYESRPNVTADAGGLCLKSGNAAILRGGSDSFHTSAAIVACLQRGLDIAGLPRTAIQMVPNADRDCVGLMLEGLGGTLDLIVPRGGKSLVARVQQDARVPVFSHLEGICHVYVDKAADVEMAKAIVLNAKMRRTGICGAAETILIDRPAPGRTLKPVIGTLIDAGCEVRGDEETRQADPRVKPATEEDWSTEYLDAIVAMKVVDGVEEAMAHIAATARSTRIRSSPRMPQRPRASSPRWTAPSCCTMPRRNSPMAANSASAPKSASPRASSMRAGPWAWNSSPPSSTRCGARPKLPPCPVGRRRHGRSCASATGRRARPRSADPGNRPRRRIRLSHRTDRLRPRPDTSQCYLRSTTPALESGHTMAIFSALSANGSGVQPNVPMTTTQKLVDARPTARCPFAWEFQHCHHR
jgi:glutamate-5-semialdehyde dehydrogenase